MTVIKAAFGRTGPSTGPAPDRLSEMLAWLPRPIRFLMVGSVGLIADVGFFTLLFAYGVHPLIARLCSLALATLLTWRLNRHLTFASSGRPQKDEAARYATVAVVAQGIGYAIFAVLALTVFVKIPQLAIVIGAAAVTLISYNGQRLVAFAPRKARDRAAASVIIFKRAAR